MGYEVSWQPPHHPLLVVWRTHLSSNTYFRVDDYSRSNFLKFWRLRHGHRASILVIFTLSLSISSCRQNLKGSISISGWCHGLWLRWTYGGDGCVGLTAASPALRVILRTRQVVAVQTGVCLTPSMLANRVDMWHSICLRRTGPTSLLRLVNNLTHTPTYVSIKRRWSKTYAAPEE